MHWNLRFFSVLTFLFSRGVNSHEFDGMFPVYVFIQVRVSGKPLITQNKSDLNTVEINFSFVQKSR
jgi:hypothetical protein